MRLAPNWEVDPDGTPWYRSPSSKARDGRSRGAWRTCKVCSEVFAAMRSNPGLYCSRSCNAKAKGIAGANVRTRPDLFEQWTADECWLAGLIWTDGHLAPATGQVTVGSTDEDIIAAAAEIAGCSYTSRVLPAPRKPYHAMRFSERHAVGRLKAIGMDRPKLTLRPFPELPYPGAFLRGAFDGDGSVRRYVDTRMKSQPDRVRSKMCGGSLFIAGLQDFLAEQGVRSVTVRSLTEKRTLYIVEWTHYTSVRIAEIMYADPGPRMERKWAAFCANPERF